MLRVLVCGYQCEKYIDRCLESIEMQEGVEYDVINAVQNKGEKRRYLLENMSMALDGGKFAKDDIICCVDGDDFLCDEFALAIVNKAYLKHECLITHGSYVNLSDSERGKFNGPYKDREDVRVSKWRASHLKTFKYGLWRALPKTALMDGGKYFRCSSDRAMMIPMMEMAGLNRVKHIDTVLYCYNDKNKHSVWNTMKDESRRVRSIIKQRKRLCPIVP